MTPFASVALFKRSGEIVFKPPRKERPADLTQARKAAMRFWSGNLSSGDVLVKVILLREFAGRLEISEGTGEGKPWICYAETPANAARVIHLSAAMAELGIDPNAEPATVPDVLVINGLTYRRDI
jgi:hypothetical protein